MVRSEADRLGRAPLQIGNELTREVNQRQLAELRPKMDAVEVRIADMDAMGVDIQAVSLSPYQLFHWAEKDLATRAFQTINDDLAKVVADHPDRFVALGAIPMQDPAQALAELKRCAAELGFRGIEMATHIEGVEISSPEYGRFWEEVEQLGLTVFLHPTGFTDPARLMDHYFVNTIGHPLEETICAGRLIFDGVMERHPGLKFVFAHGGGFLPLYWGRFDHAYHAREDVRQKLPKPPSEYLAMFHFDTMVFDPRQLGYLIDRYGADHVLLGTDYPYDMGETDPLGLLDEVGGLSDADRSLIAGGNAARLLGLGS
jgi:aminocarboxymuconate-semialdehyde decarboxylase